jgi:hypothetical protein
MVAADLYRRGHKVAFPYGEDWDYDLIVCREGRLERVQVKHTRSDGRSIIVRCQSHSLTNGRVRATKRYTAEMVDWIAIHDATTERCLGESGSGASRDRTGDLLLAKQALSHLSYGPERAECSGARSRHSVHRWRPAVKIAAGWADPRTA